MHNKVKKRIRENVSPWPQFVDCRGQGYNAFYTYGAFVRVWYERAAEKVQINCDAFLFCYCKWYKYTEWQCTQLDKSTDTDTDTCVPHSNEMKNAKCEREMW